MQLKLVRLTFFVDDIEKTITYYNQSLGVDFNILKNDVEIAFHRGKGRKPRLEFETNVALTKAREELNAQGARIGIIKKLAGKSICAGKDPNGVNIQVSSKK